ncbi:MAG TPA: hypothetical protein VEF53_05200 [Patescibacteria group bacterium]|nr:hypothetical protein [Patescibacteria group bacterium]
MSQDRSSIHSSNLAIDVIIDYTKRLYPKDKTLKLDSITDEKQKIKVLHEIIFGEKSVHQLEESETGIWLEKMREKLSDTAARKYIEEGIKKEVINLMQKEKRNTWRK